MTELKENQKAYWQHFNDFLFKRQSTLKPKRNPLGEQWHVIKLGRRVHLEVVANGKGNRVEVYFTDKKERNERRFALLERDFKDASIREFGSEVKWELMPANKLSKISLIREGKVEFDNNEKRNEQFLWLAETAEKMHSFFEPKLKELDID
ncbi:MAG: DUF4268 domain-containing protein [Flavipsychrobacter sp.]|nr:DUF4268 domain-containing protein [Flavipsychrobacter sp.]